MGKDKVWQTLHDYIQPPKGTDLALEVEDWRAGLGMAAEIIAAQHNLELARARSEKTELLTCGHPASVADDDGCAMCRLVAQVAMMTEALGHYANEELWTADVEIYLESGEYPDADGNSREISFSYDTGIKQVWVGHNGEDGYELAQKALSAAPKVFCLKGRTSKYYDLEAVADDAPDEFRQLLIERGMFAPWDVMVCLPKAGQPTESEQEGTDG